MSQGTRWLQKPVKAVLLDITGVLYESGTTSAISGSIEAIKKLRSSGLPFRLLTNETQHPVKHLLQKLNSFGYDFKESEIIAPMPVTREYLLKRKLRPLLLVHQNVLSEFESVPQQDPNCVVVGDAAEHFTYEAMNQVFQLLIKLKEQITESTHLKSLLISMGKNKFYKEHGKLVLDLGAYTSALEYACDLKALVIGKPGPQYFGSALEMLGIDSNSRSDVVMVGDDIIGDVKGAQDCGLKGVLVRSGKYRPSDENHPLVKPNAIVANLSEAIDQIVQSLK